MRYFFLAIGLLLVVTTAQAQSATVTIDVDSIATTVTLSAVDQLAMKNDLLSISDWIEQAIVGKVNKTRERMVRQGIATLRASGQSVPASDDAVINALVARPGYQNRRQREDAADPIN